ncbi:hypothetical protein [Nonomuraea turcica]|uniref:hypothetical protein n=1 Tax=Nonomuraea sp. G32 TaxID=3067274 RepID=UPI00273AF68C|nr:hypothetical protein [Nonomuraea sp. G32]MDP4505791.1 hypothetical protein [Nonomuraea sp. G32]
MVTRKSPWLWISLLVGGLVAGALGVIFIVLDLEQADQLASVVGVFVALAGLGISVYGVVLARRGQASSPVSSSATAARSGADAGHTTITGAGDTNNTIKGGTFHAPVTMARDITGPPVLPPTPPPPSPSEGPDGSEQPR